MTQRIRDRPILSFGDVSYVETRRNSREFFDGGQPPLAAWKVLIATLWAVPIITHELVHYVVGRLLGVEIRGVVLFQYGTEVGFNLFRREGLPDWKYHVFAAAPLVVCGPLGWYTIQWGQATPSLFLSMFAAALGSGFFYCAIPDQLRNGLLKWWATREE